MIITNWSFLVTETLKVEALSNYFEVLTSWWALPTTPDSNMSHIIWQKLNPPNEYHTSLLMTKTFQENCVTWLAHIRTIHKTHQSYYKTKKRNSSYKKDQRRVNARPDSGSLVAKLLQLWPKYFKDLGICRFRCNWDLTYDCCPNCDCGIGSLSPKKGFSIWNLLRSIIANIWLTSSGTSSQHV